MSMIQSHISPNYGQNNGSQTSPGDQPGTSASKPPPLPSKLPPPPPPPPAKDLRPLTAAPPTAPPPPPPPPPRNSSQFSSQSNLAIGGQSSSGMGTIGPSCSSSNGGNSSSGVVGFNNGPSSINPLAVGRYNFNRNVEVCGSRSSLSSHNSSVHHHHPGMHATNLTGPQSGTSSHQANHATTCPSLHPNPTDVCHLHTTITGGHFAHGGSCCAHSSSNHSSSNKCLSHALGSNPNLRIPHINTSGSATMPSPSQAPANRGAQFVPIGSPDGSASLTEHSSRDFDRGANELIRFGHPCASMSQHHHHHDHHHHMNHNHIEPNHRHQNLHSIHLSSSSSVSSSLQPISDQNSLIGYNGSQAYHERFNANGNNNHLTTMQSQHGTVGLPGHNQPIGHITNGSNAKALLNDCDHHHACMENHQHDHHHHHHHQHSSNTECQQHQAMSGGCAVHSNGPMVMHSHDCGQQHNGNINSMNGGNKPTNHVNLSNQTLHHHESHRGPARCFETSPSANESATHTAHAHNLSNSSTTTHTSNVAVRHQTQFYPFDRSQLPTMLRSNNAGGRSNSSQQCDTTQYGLSSAASTSSATASLSGCPHQAHLAGVSHRHQHDETIFHQRNRLQQQQSLPPAPPPQPPPPPPHLSSSMQAGVFLSAQSNGQPPLTGALQQQLHGQQQFHGQLQTPSLGPSTSSGQQTTAAATVPPPPPPPPHPMISHTLPPLPPKPDSPIASSCSTQLTTVRTSPPQIVTRTTSQAGVQAPLPSSDIPPPLPPLNPGSRLQLVQSQRGPFAERSQNGNNLDANLNYANNGAGGGNFAPLAINNPISSQPQQHQFSSGSLASNEQSNNHQNLINLVNYQRGGIFTDAERKTELLTRQVELELEQEQKSGEPLGVCPKCSTKVMPAQEACRAMNQIYHAACFVCCECGRTLLGKAFYPVGDRAYCEEDFKYTGHMQSLEKCAACSQPIFDMILPAMGKFYHPECFKCCICSRCLDGVPFTFDRKNKIYCVKDYHSIYSPKCAACGLTITPLDGTGETVRVVSMNNDYHVDCYCCEDCGLPLTDEEPSRSYPLDNHLLCQHCHINRLSKMQAALSLD